MNVRVLRIESRRSVAPWASVVLLAASVAFLYLVPGSWSRGTAQWTAQWTSMALWTRCLLIFLWPTGLRGILDPPERSRTAVLVDFDDSVIADAEGEELTRALLAQGVAPICFARSANESGTLRELAAQTVAASWFLGDLKPFGGTMYSSSDQLEAARPVWTELKALPRSEQVARVKAAHAAAVSCDGDPLGMLDGGTSR
ncbi:hypothetical protein WBG99_25570 [Streptomyces sp. TG1A-60]|uniref:hypothetical protein n=1 Tax=Streptomyces sp. TG1A-60 TaxID=3129111 RepID=UPI0030D62503